MSVIHDDLLARFEIKDNNRCVSSLMAPCDVTSEVVGVLVQTINQHTRLFSLQRLIDLHSVGTQTVFKDRAVRS